MVVIIKGKITKIGNSLGVRIPVNYLKEMNIDLGDEIQISYDNRLKCIVISNSEDTLNELFERNVIEIVSKHFDKLD